MGSPERMEECHVEIELQAARDEVARLEDELREARARVKALRPAGKVKDPRECSCGCGGMTGGGLFQPGHDAKLRSRLLSAIRAGDEAALTTLLDDFPTLLHGADPQTIKDQLGSDIRKADAAVAREAEAQIKRDEASKKVRPAPKPTSKGRVDIVEKQQGTRSPSVAKNGVAIRLAKSRAA